MNEGLHAELLALEAEDLHVRDELARDGSLFHGYHPRMEAVHRKNATRLREIIAEHGWPGRSLVGEDGAEAAWRIAQHSIGEPAFFRKAHQLVHQAADRGDAPAWQAAYMLDRIRTLEGKPQVYGSQFDWDENGQMSPLPIEDPEHVNERRAAVGLPPIEEITRKHRENARLERRPADWKARQNEMEDWAHRAGWRKERGR
jgi:hypothetical protein